MKAEAKLINKETAKYSDLNENFRASLWNVHGSITELTGVPYSSMHGAHLWVPGR
jgi:hypothetical protein